MTFEARVQAAIKECRELGYNPSDLEKMVNNSGAVNVAKRLVTDATIQSGLRRIQEIGRLDLAIESIMLEPEHQHNFTAPELEAARWRLNNINTF